MSDDNTQTLSMEYLLGKIDQIASDTSYLHEAIAALQGMQSDPAFADNPKGDNANQAKALALSQALECRETTNQQLIALYTKMYEDIKAPSPDDKTDQLRRILEVLADVDEERLEHMDSIAEKVLGAVPPWKK